MEAALRPPSLSLSVSGGTVLLTDDDTWAFGGERVRVSELM